MWFSKDSEPTLELKNRADVLEMCGFSPGKQQCVMLSCFPSIGTISKTSSDK